MNTVAESKRIMSDLISSKDIEFIEHIFDLELLCQFEFNQSENLVTLTFLHNSITTNIDEKLLKFPKPNNIKIDIELGYSEVPRVVDGSIYEKKVRNHQDTVTLYIKDSKTMTNLKYVNSIADIDIDIMEIVKGKRNGDAIEIDYKSLSKQPDKDYSKKPKLSGVRVEKFVDKMPSWFDKFKSPDVPNIKIEATFRTREEQEALMYNRPNPHHGSGDMVDAMYYTLRKMIEENSYIYVFCLNMNEFDYVRKEYFYRNSRNHNYEGRMYDKFVQSSLIPIITARHLENLRGIIPTKCFFYVEHVSDEVLRYTQNHYDMSLLQYMSNIHRGMTQIVDLNKMQ